MPEPFAETPEALVRETLQALVLLLDMPAPVPGVVLVQQPHLVALVAKVARLLELVTERTEP
jgi:hypothetical protein